MQEKRFVIVYKGRVMSKPMSKHIAVKKWNHLSSLFLELKIIPV